MTTSDDGHGRRGGGRLKIGDTADVGALYPNLYFAPLESIADLPAAAVVDAVLRSGHESSREPGERSHSAAQVVVSVDPPHRFDPELSMREPLELQVWPDGAFTVEIEFMGEDVRTHPDAAESVQEVLVEWAEARGWRLAGIYNDRG